MTQHKAVAAALYHSGLHFLFLLLLCPAAQSTLYCDSEGLLYSNEQQTQIDALLMSQVVYADGATAVKAHPTQGYLYVPDDCKAVVTLLNSKIGGGRDVQGNVRGAGGQLFCKTESGDVDVEMIFSADCEKDAWQLSQFFGLSSPTTTQTSTPTTTPTSTQTTTPTTTTAAVSAVRRIAAMCSLQCILLMRWCLTSQNMLNNMCC